MMVLHYGLPVSGSPPGCSLPPGNGRQAAGEPGRNYVVAFTNCGANWTDPAPQLITGSTGKTADLEMMALGTNIRPGDPDSLDILKVQQIELFKFMVENPEWNDSSTLLNKFFIAMNPDEPGNMKEIEQYLANRDTANADYAIENYEPVDDIGDNYEAFYSLQLKWERLGADGWEEQDRADLFDIAVKCSYKEGEVVFAARALYAIVNDRVEHWDDGCSNTTQSRGVAKRKAKTWLPGVNEKQELLNGEQISLFPNPSSGEVNVAIPASLGNNWQVRVTSVDGRTVPLFNYQGINGIMQFSLKVSPGMYYVHVENLDTHSFEVKKLLVK